MVAMPGSFGKSWTQTGVLLVEPNILTATAQVAEVWALQDPPSLPATASTDRADRPQDARTTHCS